MRFVFSSLALSGCALISGLSNIGVGVGDGGTDAAENDAAIENGVDAAADVVSDSDARPEFALQFAGNGCAQANTMAAAATAYASDFTLIFWLRQDATSIVTEPRELVWHGAETSTSPGGWNVAITSNALEFCVAGGNGQTCTPPFGISLGHLLHVAAIYSGGALSLYVLDATAGQTVHQKVGGATGALAIGTQGFAIGGAIGGNNGCHLTAVATIDEVAMAGVAVPITYIDQGYLGKTVMCSQSTSAWLFDEGMGMTTMDSCSGKNAMMFGPNVTFIPSPFP